MRFKPDKKYIHMGITAFIVAVCIILFIFAVFNYPVFAAGFSSIIRVLSPVINGFLIAYLLNPVVSFFENRFFPKLFRALKINKDFGVRRKRLVRYISIGISVALTVIIIGSFISILIPQLIKSIKSIIHQMPVYISNLNAMLNKVFDDNPEILDYLNQSYDRLEKWSEEFMTKAPDYLNQVWGTVSLGIMRSVSFVWNLVIGLILSVYILSFKEKFLAQCRKITLACFSRKRANGIFEEVQLIDGIFKNYIVSSIIDSAIIGFLCFLLCLILGIPYANLISVIVGITNIIPFFGPFIGAIPSTIFILMIDPIKAVYFMIMILILQQFDGNVLKPKIFGDSTGLPAFWVVVSIIVGGGLFGVMGMYLGTPVFAVIYSNLKRSIAKKLISKGLPPDTSKYVRSDELPYEVPKEEGSVASTIIEKIKDTINPEDEGNNDSSDNK